ncbi:Gfo/Idh/MocA family oxidoreductase [Paenibacillus sp. GD4]|uniref:Gfo/Idh/MocA family protein n=1 Tax=Paenibacillus sp. GD4 TaxID=3068890 RepID=UPI0027964703|nr:Gfo/Idh/MocA family oxidoreductase [Paenibacillus sp. GD4]MDQ1914198.1 Gfo/Idh/MocA family oxidoreductase [Paenibacillus sp. GD4]
MSGKPRRAGIIGLGRMANGHIRNLLSLEGTAITAICDVNESAVKSKGEELGLPEHKRYRNYAELIDDPEVDFVISVVSNQFHYDILKKCIEAGKPVLSEKPFTRTMEEAEELLALYRERPIPCMIGFSYRYVPAFRYIKGLLERQEIGRIRHFAAYYLQEENVPMHNQPYAWRFSKEAAGSGVLADIGSHMIDAARYFVGEFQTVSAMMATFVDERIDPLTNQPAKVDVDDFTSFQGVLEGGVMGTFYTHKNAVGTRNEFKLTIYGDNGTIEACVEQPQTVRLCVRRGPGEPLFDQTIQLPQERNRLMLEDFLTYMEDPAMVQIPTFMDGYRNQKVLQLILESAAEGVAKHD